MAPVWLPSLLCRAESPHTCRLRERPARAGQQARAAGTAVSRGTDALTILGPACCHADRRDASHVSYVCIGSASEVKWEQWNMYVVNDL